MFESFRPFNERSKPDTMRSMVAAGGSVERDGHLLVADDDPAVLRATGTWLRRNGYRVTTVNGRDSVIEAIESDRFDLLVTDIHMPGNHELQLLVELRKIRPELPVVIMTGFPSVPSAIKALRLEAVDYLLKHVHPDALLETVAKGLDKSRTFNAIAEARAQALAIAEGLARLGGQDDQHTPPPAPTSGRAAGNVVDNLPPAERELLSNREAEVLEQLATGQRVADVARVLNISHHTVRSHLKSIFRKLNVDSQIELLGKLHCKPR